MSETYTIYAPGAWVGDIMPAMESWASDFEGVDGDHWTHDGKPLTALDRALRDEVLPQYEDPSRQVKRGRGYAWRFDLTLDGVRALRGEALYRFEFHEWDGKYGNEYAEAKLRRAAKVLLDRCDEVLAQHGGVS